MKLNKSLRLMTLCGGLLFNTSLSAKPKPFNLNELITEAWRLTLLNHREEGFRVDILSDGQHATWAPHGNTEFISVPLTTSTVAVYHTHPLEANGHLSGHDIEFAVKYKVKVYVIYLGKVTEVVDLTGTVSQVTW